MKIQVEGIEELSAAIAAMGLNVEQVLGDAVLETATSIATDVKTAIHQGTPRGKSYSRGKRAMHVASAPGQAPASDTGRLVGSIYTEMSGPLTATSGSPLAYSYHLEFGTRRMAPRPVWMKMVKANEGTFRASVKARLTGLIV